MESVRRFIKNLRFTKVEYVTEEGRSYIGFDGEQKVHACDDMATGYEGEFCNTKNLYFIEAIDNAADISWRMNYNGYSYACDNHVRKLALAFELNMEEKFIEHKYDRWEDAQAKREEQEVSFNTCRICLCDMSEHNWEAHTAEMKASANADY